MKWGADLLFGIMLIKRIAIRTIEHCLGVSKCLYRNETIKIMRTRNYLFLTALIIINACNDENPSTPDAKACFSYAPDTEINMGDEVSFSNCSEDANTYAWDFGDGHISTDEIPTHIYQSGGEYTVKMIAANETSVDTVSKTITIANGGGYFSVNETQYTLSKGALVFFNSTSKWHQLILYHSMVFSISNENYVSGTGNLVYLDILSGKSKFNISGSYTNNTDPFDATDEDKAGMQNLTIYNGFAALAYNFNGDTFKPSGNDIGDLYENSDYKNWSMKISETSSIYTIDISFTVGSKSIKIFYQGELELFEE